MIFRNRMICGTANLALMVGIATATADLPDSGGVWCPTSVESPPSCSVLGGNGGPDFAMRQTPGGESHTPALPARAQGSAEFGSRSVATGFSTVP